MTSHGTINEIQATLKLEFLKIQPSLNIGFMYFLIMGCAGKVLYDFPRDY